MTDKDLAAFLGITDDPHWPRAIANLDPERRATFERMHDVENELALWKAGVGQKPAGVIVCRERRMQTRKS